MSLRYARWLVLLLLPLLGACESDQPKFKMRQSASSNYFQATQLVDRGLGGEALVKLNNIVWENPGSKVANYAYLRLGDLYSERKEWDDAAAKYRMFLTLNPNSHLTPYALYKLFVASYNKSLVGMILPTPEVDRNISIQRGLVMEYTRFYLLYPNSPYLQKILPYYQASLVNLALYERMVGDFYMEREMYNSAIGRYQYLLRQYPAYPQTVEVVDRLIEAYRKNKEPQKADELVQVRQRLFGKEPHSQGGQPLQPVALEP